MKTLIVSAAKLSQSVPGRTESFYRSIPDPSKDEINATLDRLGDFFEGPFENVLSFEIKYDIRD